MEVEVEVEGDCWIVSCRRQVVVRGEASGRDLKVRKGDTRPPPPPRPGGPASSRFMLHHQHRHQHQHQRQRLCWPIDAGAGRQHMRHLPNTALFRPGRPELQLQMQIQIRDRRRRDVEYEYIPSPHRSFGDWRPRSHNNGQRPAGDVT